MKRLDFLPLLGAVAAVSAVALTACESKLERKHIVGRWELVSVESKIDGVADTASYTDVADSYYLFAADSTYVFSEDGEEESGLWTLDDSLLGTMPFDSTDYNLARVLRCNADTLIISLPNDTTEYGVLSETHVFVRQQP